MNNTVEKVYTIFFKTYFLQNKGYLFISYNLGTEDIKIFDKTRKLNDGNHHVVK